MTEAVRIKKILTYLVMAVLLAAIGFELFRPLILDCVSVLKNGVGTEQYLQVWESESGEVCAVSAHEDGLTLVKGDRQGGRTERTQLSCDALPEFWRLEDIYLAGESACYVSLYALDDTGAAISLQVYCMDMGSGDTSLLLDRPCRGDYTSQQVRSVALSSFSLVDEMLTFAVLENGQAIVYQMVEGESGLTEGKAHTMPQMNASCVLSDGRLAAAGSGELFLSGSEQILARPGQVLTLIRQSGAGVYTLDAAGLQLLYTELTSPDRYQKVLSLEKKEYDLNGLVDMAITGDGQMLLLLSDGRLLLDRGSAVTDLSGILYRTPLLSGVILAGMALAVLFLAFVLWLILCQWQGLRVSLALRWGAVFVAVALLGANWVLRCHVRPGMEENAALRAYELAAAVTELDSSDIHALASSMASSGGTLTADVSVTVYEKDENSFWRVSESTDGSAAWARAELTGSFDRDLALSAQRNGSACSTVTVDGQPRFLYLRSFGSELMAVSIGGRGLLSSAEAEYRETAAGVWILAFFLAALMILVCVLVVIHLRRISRGMEQLSSGCRYCRLDVNTGDELEAMSSSVNHLALRIRDLEREQRSLADSYRRFVPENLLALLEKTRLEEVDKTTFTSRRMATMMIWFGFPPEVYDIGGQQLFDHLNQVIERTAPIIAQNGGTVFNFAYNGYDAVFEGDLRVVISTAVAVQQEILSVNRERELDGRPCVKLRIALDVGNILMGVVGDSNLLEPTAISTTFSVTKRLIDLCGELDASILCTEAVVAAAEGYGSRYVGKCTVGGKSIRTYEIYDGDPFEIRRVKAQTEKEFSQGVYLLYSRNFSGAKRIFLDLVHHNVGDGGAKYYLYLAHELEADTEQEISLDYRLR